MGIIQAVYIACDRDNDKLILISMPHTFMLCFIVCHTFTEICLIKKAQNRLYVCVKKTVQCMFTLNRKESRDPSWDTTVAFSLAISSLCISDQI